MHHPPLPAAGDEGRDELIAGQPPAPEGDHRGDQVRRAHLAGTGFGAGRGTSIGSTTISRTGPERLTSSRLRHVTARSIALFIAAGSLLWGVAFDGFQPDRADLIGALVCLTGVGIIMYAR
jgi:hypothetical protein